MSTDVLVTPTRAGADRNPVRRQRQVETICALGSRVVAELLDELARHHGIAADIDHRLARYAACDPVLLAATGGDRFPTAIWAVGDGTS